MITIYSVFANKKEAQSIAELLVKYKLAGCVNIFPIDSVYSWQGKIVKDKEFSAFIKTKNGNFKEVEQFILKHHSYAVPCIEEIKVGNVTAKYLKWLDNVLY